MSVLEPSSRLLDEIQPGQLVTISGATGSGRTALACAIAGDLVRRGHRVGVVSMQPWDTDREGRNIEFDRVVHVALAVDGERPDSTSAVVYDYGSTWDEGSYAASLERDLSAGRIVILVSMPTALFDDADIRVVVGRPSRRLFAEVFGVDAPSDGVPSPLRGTAFVAPRSGRPVLISFSPA